MNTGLSGIMHTKNRENIIMTLKTSQLTEKGEYLLCHAYFKSNWRNLEQN